MFKETGTGYGDAEGLINYARSIKGVDIAMSFTELASGRVKVSFRSKKDSLDVNRIAGFFNGGGHTRAAGAVINEKLEKAREKVLRRVYNYMKGR